MSTDGPQPTQGTPKKKKRGKSVGCFLGVLFFPCFLFLFFGGPLLEQLLSQQLGNMALSQGT
jgi:hypothetical protein